MYIDDARRLRDMLEAARSAVDFVRGRSREDLDSDRMLVYAIVHAVQIIGESASRVTAARREELPEIPWSDIVGMRHRVVHDYTRVNLDVVWRTVSDDLPSLIVALERAVQSPN